jgi:L-ascorbate metabolism protein UlaG (beta-lactamase superfamily)
LKQFAASAGIGIVRPVFLTALHRLRTSVPEALFHREERPAGAGLAVQWVGTAGFRVVADGHHFWIDPYLSRHSFAELFGGRIAPKPDLVERDVDVAHAVALGHSHFDHALDAPLIARLRSARVYGSSDMLNYCRGNGVPEEQLREIRGGERLEEGPFTLRPVLSRHSTFLFGRVPFPGRIERPLPYPLRASDLKVGTVFGIHLEAGGTSVYHIGSANLVESELQGIHADVVLCCTVGRQSTERYTERVIAALRPKLVIPCHWDQFWRPLDSPVLQIPGNDLEGFVREVRGHPLAPEVRVRPPRGWCRVRPPVEEKR